MKMRACLNTFELSVQQQDVLTDIKQQFEQKEVVLLHGVTSSGKTQILYPAHRGDDSARQTGIVFICPKLRSPHILLSACGNIFGGNIGVYHSRFNDNERVEVWQKVLNNEYKVVFGRAFIRVFAVCRPGADHS